MRVELSPAGKLIVFGLLGLIALAIGVAQAPDARRYIKMESM